MTIDERILVLFDRFIVFGLTVQQVNTTSTGENALSAKKMV